MHLKSYEPTEEFDTGGLLKSVLIGALLGGAFHLLFNRSEKRLFHDVPPIGLISDPNSGESITIETSSSLNEFDYSPQASPSDRSALARKSYPLSFRFDIDEVRVFGGVRPFYYDLEGGREVRFWLQSRNRQGGWDGELYERQEDILISTSSKSATIVCDKLPRRNTGRSHPDRPFTHALKRSKDWRVGRIQFEGHSRDIVARGDGRLEVIFVSTHHH